MGAGSFEIFVGIATAGRRGILSHAIEVIGRQRRLPDRIFVCPARSDDFDGASSALARSPVTVVTGKPGLTRQRNRILSAVGDHGVMVFFDDDFFPREDYLASVERIFLFHPDVVALTGRPILDGANGPGLEVAEGLSVLQSAEIDHNPDDQLSETYGMYGCNMAFRLAPAKAHSIYFDERLPLYGWQEDIDFSRSLSPHGRIVESASLRGVHLGSKSGRTSGTRLGYSQIANPLYLRKKGTMSASFARSLICRNVAANVLRSFRPEPWIDRRGRLKGNVLALWDVGKSRVSPDRVFSID